MSYKFIPTNLRIFKATVILRKTSVHIQTHTCNGPRIHTYKPTYFQGNCDFEKDLCTWTNTKQKDNFDWLRSRGRTSTLNTGPAADHTKGSSLGYYLYLESSAPRVPGDRARLLSQAFPPVKGAACMLFYYHMYGRDVGVLRVKVLTNISSDKLSTEATLWQLQGDSGNTWYNAQVNVSAIYTSKPYQVRAILVIVLGPFHRHSKPPGVHGQGTERGRKPMLFFGLILVGGPWPLGAPEHCPPSCYTSGPFIRRGLDQFTFV